MKLHDFYFGHEGMFLIPLEHISPAGMTEAYASALMKARDVDQAWVDMFNAAYALYWQRTTDLYQRAPETWFPPRRQNICVISDAAHTRPYYQPFNRNSWVVYQSDFDAETSSAELATYQFLHIERFFLSGSVVATLANSLSYFLTLDERQLEDFCAGCRRCTRPDASGFAAVADAMPWIQRLFHEKLKPPPFKLGEPAGRLQDAQLVVLKALEPDLQALVKAAVGAASDAQDAHFASFDSDKSEAAADALCKWLSEDKPSVMVTGSDGVTLWDPEQPGDTSALRSQLGGVSERVAASIRADLAVAGARYTAFISSLRDPSVLPLPEDDIEQSGLTYIHNERRLIAYNLLEPEMNRLREVAAPYERLMLGARTIHELGHLAVDAGLVGIPDEKKDAHREAHEALIELFEKILSDAPLALGKLLAREIELLAAKANISQSERGRALAAIPLRRMPDYLCNVLARDYLPHEELETYVRQQVNTLAQEDVGPFAQLSRYAYEFQYLSLSHIDDPEGYFFDCTWFDQHFVAPRIATRERMSELFAAMSRLCACYAVDRSGFVER